MRGLGFAPGGAFPHPPQEEEREWDAACEGEGLLSLLPGEEEAEGDRESEIDRLNKVRLIISLDRKTQRESEN